jgi:hypothetical protein
MRKGRVAPNFKIRSRAAIQDTTMATDYPDVCGQYVPSGQPLPDKVDWRATSMGGLQPGAGLVNPPKVRYFLSLLFLSSSFSLDVFES